MVTKKQNKKPARIARGQARAIKSEPRANALLRALRAAGLFRWERLPSKSENVLDILTHGIGIGLAIAGLAVLCAFAAVYQNWWALVSCAIFGATMFTLYFGSTMCHAMVGQKSECFFEVWDSVAIYALIAGTYTPFLLVNMRGWVGWTVFGILWAVTIFGAVMKIRRPKQQPKWIVLLYLIMGWTVLFILPKMIATVSPRALVFALAGGLSYSIGVLFYLWRRLKYSHMIWHLLVIAGSVCFFFAVLFGTIIDFVG
ncbi:MAG: hemolysin III family protein [Alphaproteobacteria bacterium]|nr:hemolysin III family protein [Alphaproteobacteria bacterium]MCL2889953.1 hemolysin III family protein [Alphaproteobacteria bacterium]